MKRLVFDEWVWADLNGENGEEAQRETLWLLQRVLEKCDQLVTVRGSPFLNCAASRDCLNQSFMPMLPSSACASSKIRTPLNG